MPTAFTGGALSFKGEKKKKKSKAKKKASQAKHKIKEDDDQVVVPEVAAPLAEDLTPAEKRAMERKRERLRIDNERLATKSHRERIEEFNEKLGSASEHNDIPRVRAIVSFCFVFRCKFGSCEFLTLSYLQLKVSAAGNG